METQTKPDQFFVLEMTGIKNGKSIKRMNVCRTSVSNIWKPFSRKIINLMKSNSSIKLFNLYKSSH